MFILKILFAPLSAYPVPVRLAVYRAAVLLRLCIQAGKRTALSADYCSADYLFRKERHHPPCAGVSDKPDGASDAGRVGAGQAARRERRHEKLHPELKHKPGRTPRLAFLKSLFTFLLISDIILARKGWPRDSL